MAEQLHYQAPHPDQHPERHEHADVRIRPLVITGVLLLVVAVVTHVGLWLLFEYYRSRADQTYEAQRQSAVRAVRTGPGEDVPRVQGVPGYSTNTAAQDMAAFRQESERALAGEEVNGKTYMPIERAMDLAVRRGIFQVSQAESGDVTETSGSPGGQSDPVSSQSPAQAGGAEGEAKTKGGEQNENASK